MGITAGARKCIATRISKMAGDDVSRWPREQSARDYMGEHKILELFNNLTSQLMYKRPDHPKDFLIESLEKLIKARTTKLDYPCLFDESNIESVFGMLDPTLRGHIKLQQYKEALQSMGITNFDPTPPGGDVDRITYDTFLREAQQGLTETSSTFLPKKK